MTSDDVEKNERVTASGSDFGDGGKNSAGPSRRHRNRFLRQTQHRKQPSSPELRTAPAPGFGLATRDSWETDMWLHESWSQPAQVASDQPEHRSKPAHEWSRSQPELAQAEAQKSSRPAPQTSQRIARKGRRGGGQGSLGRIRGPGRDEMVYPRMDMMTLRGSPHMHAYIDIDIETDIDINLDIDITTSTLALLQAELHSCHLCGLCRRGASASPLHQRHCAAVCRVHLRPLRSLMFFRR